MKRDVQFGLLLTLASAMAICPRFLPSLEATEESLLALLATPPPDKPEPAPIEPAIAVAKAESPVVQSEKSSALTDIVPDGYPQALTLPDATTATSAPVLAADNAATVVEDDAHEEISTEFVPFITEETVEPAPEPAPLVLPARTRESPKRESPKSADPVPIPRALPKERPSATGNQTYREEAPARSPSASRREAIVVAEDRSQDSGFDDTRVAQSARAGPVHPYFKRYLDRKEYYVRPGETLRDIAYRLYSDADKADRILAANQPTLRSAADLKPGMFLRLP